MDLPQNQQKHLETSLRRSNIRFRQNCKPPLATRGLMTDYQVDRLIYIARALMIVRMCLRNNKLTRLLSLLIPVPRKSTQMTETNQANCGDLVLFLISII